MLSKHYYIFSRKFGTFLLLCRFFFRRDSPLVFCAAKIGKSRRRAEFIAFLTHRTHLRLTGLWLRFGRKTWLTVLIFAPLLDIYAQTKMNIKKTVRINHKVEDGRRFFSGGEIWFENSRWAAEDTNRRIRIEMQHSCSKVG